MRESKRAGSSGTLVARLRTQLNRVTGRRSQSSSFLSPGSVLLPHENPPVRVYAVTPAGVKVHLLREDGKTMCGFDHLQLVLTETPLPAASFCDWCRGAS